jgi:SAM-dependent methyltransferase
MNICKVCSSPSSPQAINVREMMFGTRESYSYYQCSNCQATQIDTFVEDPELLYPSNYRSFTFNRTGLTSIVKRYIHRHVVAAELGLPTIIGNVIIKFRPDRTSRSIKNFIKRNQKVLDVGSGNGELLEALSGLGYQRLTGVDPFIAAEINHKNWHILKQDIFALDEDEKYDLIMLHHSFEHMSNPKEIIGKLSTVLAPNGVCIIRIPVCDSTAFALYREDWVQFDAPRHSFLHTDASMRHMCELANLKVDQIVQDSYEFQFIGSEQYKSDIPLSDPKSYYKSFLLKILNPNQPFSRKEIHDFQERSLEANRLGLGDQRNYIIRHADYGLEASKV